MIKSDEYSVCNFRLSASQTVFDEIFELTANQAQAACIHSECFCRIVAFRSANKLGFYVDVTPDPDLSVDTDVWITFSFKFDHYDTVTITQILRDDESKRKLEVKWLKQTVYINLGKVKA